MHEIKAYKLAPCPESFVPAHIEARNEAFKVTGPVGWNVPVPRIVETHETEAVQIIEHFYRVYSASFHALGPELEFHYVDASLLKKPLCASQYAELVALGVDFEEMHMLVGNDRVQAQSLYVDWLLSGV